MLVLVNQLVVRIFYQVGEGGKGMIQEMLDVWWHLGCSVSQHLRQCVSLYWAKTLRHKYLLIEELAVEHYSSRAAYSWPDL